MSQDKITPIERKEANDFLVSAKNSKARLPQEEKSILQWTPAEFKEYFRIQTKGMSVTKKMKFGQELVKKIEEEKKKNAKKS